MGLFSFIKEAGAKIFGSTPANAATADNLQKELAGHGLPSDVNIQIDGDKVKVSGKAVSTEEAEKIILALGNTTGVAQVESDLDPAHHARRRDKETACHAAPPFRGV
ncbi:BON domain-containing protein [Bosea sp. TAB14]|uniref:BON domain-containing protein n=1 Tax=Bosea sp. TAB14 TaxID=3237481 RepID=UPI003F8E83C9